MSTTQHPISIRFSRPDLDRIDKLTQRTGLSRRQLLEQTLRELSMNDEMLAQVLGNAEVRAQQAELQALEDARAKLLANPHLTAYNKR
jgi:hypothetical protein